MSNLWIYLIGFTLIIAGLAWGAATLGIPPVWIGIGVLVLIGIAVISGVSKTRYREPSPEDKGSRRVVVDDDS